jgi:hypothetical protein
VRRWPPPAAGVVVVAALLLLLRDDQSLHGQTFSPSGGSNEPWCQTNGTHIRHCGFIRELATVRT